MTPNDIILALSVNLAEVIADRQQLRIENEQLKSMINQLEGETPKSAEVFDAGN